MSVAAALAQQRAMRGIAAAAAAAALSGWGDVDEDDVSASWTELLPTVLAGVAAAQIAAAVLAQPYVDDAAGRAARTRTGRLNPAGFGGIASDGRPLLGLLFQPALTAMAALLAGTPPRRAFASGLAVLDMIVRTQVADAGRTATGVAIAAQPAIAGHERIVRLPACKRCVVLAGRLYRWSAGFARHPRCDCTMRPVTRDEYRTTELDNNPRKLFDRMTGAQQDQQFGKAAARAIRDGADISQVVNVDRGVTTAAVYGREIQTTTEGTTLRGVAGQRLARVSGTRVASTFDRTTADGGTQRVRLRGAAAPRLMPEEIYRLAEDREDATRLLTLHGYLL